MSDKIRAAIIGASLDGKTSLAAAISKGLWPSRKFRSLAFDPFKGETEWGRQALVIGPTKAQVKTHPNPDKLISAEFARFKRVARGIEPHQKIAVFWDEGTDTGGRDSDNTGLFTAIRHSTDIFFFIGHGYQTMLPLMRSNLTDVFLAVRDAKEARDWATLFVDEAVMQCTQLKQYEFLHKRKHRQVQILRPTAQQIKHGIIV